jgi:hypothetical protein
MEEHERQIETLRALLCLINIGFLQFSNIVVPSKLVRLLVGGVRVLGMNNLLPAWSRSIPYLKRNPGNYSS